MSCAPRLRMPSAKRSRRPPPGGGCRGHPGFVLQRRFHSVPYASAASYANESGLTRSAGVNNYNGRRETYYSSNVLYHYRTGEWTQDSEGFWRDSDGYYVVAAGDMAQGSTFTGSKGECKVYDSGCAAGTTDYYTGW
ncbi:MAG: hypothetical protein ACLTYW_04765 [Collinsella sp.]